MIPTSFLDRLLRPLLETPVVSPHIKRGYRWRQYLRPLAEGLALAAREPPSLGSGLMAEYTGMATVDRDMLFPIYPATRSPLVCVGGLEAGNFDSLAARHFKLSKHRFLRNKSSVR